MIIRSRVTKAIIPITLLLLISSLSYLWFFFIYHDGISHNLADALVEELESVLNSSITIENIGTSLMGNIILDNVTISPKGENQGLGDLFIEEVEVRYDLLSFVRSRFDVSQMIGDIFLRSITPVSEGENLILWESDARIRWGEDHVKLVSAHFSLDSPDSNSKLQIDNINGILGIHSSEIVIDIEGEVLGDEQGYIEIKGAYGLIEDFIELRAKFDQIDLYPIADIGILDIPFTQIFAGEASGFIDVETISDGAIWVSGEADVTRGEFKYFAINEPFYDVEGTIEFNMEDVNIKRLQGTLDGMTMVMSGTVKDFSDPVYDLFFKIPPRGLGFHISVVEIMEILGIDGDGLIELKVKGTTGDLYVSGKGSMSSGTMLGQLLNNVFVEFTSIDEEWEFPGFKMDIGGGSLTGDVNLSLKEELQWRVSMDAVGVEMKDLKPPFEFIYGSGKFTGNIEVYTDREEGVLAIGTGTIKDGEFISNNFDKAEGKLQYYHDHGIISIDELMVNKDRNQADIKGSVNIDGSMDLTIDGQNLDIAEILEIAQLTDLQLSGSGDIQAIVTGNLQEPYLSGNISITEANIFEHEFESIEGYIIWNSNILSSDELIFKDGKGKYNVSGNLDLGPNNELDLRVKVTGVDIANMIGLTGYDLVFSGEILGDILVYGSLANPHINGELDLETGYILGQSIDGARLRFKYDGDNFKLEELTGAIGGIPLRIGGLVSDINDLNLDINIDEAQLNEIDFIQASFLPDLDGRLSFSGEIRGNLEAPAINGIIVGENISVEDLELNSVYGNVEFTREGIKTAEGVIEEDMNENGIYHVFINENDYRIEVSNVRFANVYGLASQLQFPDGILNEIPNYIVALETIFNPSFGLIDGIFWWDRKNGEITVTARDLMLGDLENTNMNLECMLIPEGVVVNNLDIDNENVWLELKGVIGLEGELEFEGLLEVSAISALLGFVELDHINTSGKVEANINISGDIENPHFSADIIGHDIWVLGTELGEVITKVSGDREKLVISDIKCKINGQTILGYGTLPFGDENYSPLDGLIISLTIQGDSIDILNMFTDEIKWGDGEILGEIHITGSNGSLDLDGKLTISDGSVYFDYLKFPLEDITVDLDLRGDKILISTLTGSSGTEGIVKGTGYLSVSKFPNVTGEIDIQVRNISVEVPSYSGLFDAEVTLIDVQPVRLLKGEISFKNGYISLEELDDTMDFPDFIDLDVRIDRTVRLKMPGIDVPLTGNLKVDGSIPGARGEILAERGQFVLFGTQFGLNHGKANFTFMNGFIPALDIKGTALVHGVRVEAMLKGTPDELDIQFISDPPFEKDTIIAFLTFPDGMLKIIEGDYSDIRLEEPVMWYVQNQLKTMILGDVSGFLQDVLRIDDLWIMSDANDKIIIKLGKYLIDIFYVSYTRELIWGDTEEIWEFDLRLTPDIRLGGTLSSEEGFEVTIDAVYQF